MYFFTWQGSNPDELSLREGELIELIADGDGDGWVRVSALTSIVTLNICKAERNNFLFRFRIM